MSTRSWRYGLGALALCAASIATGAWLAQPNAVNAASALAVPSDDRWANAMTQADMNEVAYDDREEVEARMNRALGRALSKARALPRGGEQVVAMILDSQAAWQRYFDAELRLRWPSGEGQGSIYPMCVWLDTSSVINARAAAIESLVDWEEGDVCGPRWTDHDFNRAPESNP